MRVEIQTGGKKEMTKVYVYFRCKNGKNRKRVWATFLLEIDAHIFEDKLKRENPDWIITCSR
jgi:hypothetical protein